VAFDERCDFRFEQSDRLGPTMYSLKYIVNYIKRLVLCKLGVRMRCCCKCIIAGQLQLPEQAVLSFIRPDAPGCSFPPKLSHLVRFEVSGGQARRRDRLECLDQQCLLISGDSQEGL
jgi:hypothetical protein